MTGKANGHNLKWIVTATVAVIGAGGGLAAFLWYWTSIRARAEERYREDLAAWEAFAPESVSRGDHEVELLGGWYIDLDTGREGESLSGSAWDLQFVVTNQGWSEGLLANEHVQWSPLGTIEFSAVRYREIRDARFQSVRKGPEDKYLYLSHRTAAPGVGAAFAVKTSDNNVAKIQIVGYTEHPSGSRNLQLRYEVFPIVADPPRPRRPRRWDESSRGAIESRYQPGDHDRRLPAADDRLAALVVRGLGWRPQPIVPQ